MHSPRLWMTKYVFGTFCKILRFVQFTTENVSTLVHLFVITTHKLEQQLTVCQEHIRMGD